MGTPGNAAAAGTAASQLCDCHERLWLDSRSVEKHRRRISAPRAETFRHRQNGWTACGGRLRTGGVRMLAKYGPVGCGRVLMDSVNGYVGVWKRDGNEHSAP